MPCAKSTLRVKSNKELCLAWGQRLCCRRAPRKRCHSPCSVWCRPGEGTDTQVCVRRNLTFTCQGVLLFCTVENVAVKSRLEEDFALWCQPASTGVDDCFCLSAGGYPSPHVVQSHGTGQTLCAVVLQEGAGL